MLTMNWLDAIKWDDKGLVPVIAQEQATGDVLMFAWMNREALQKTAELGRAVYLCCGVQFLIECWTQGWISLVFALHNQSYPIQV